MDDSWQPRCRAPRDLVAPVPVDPTGDHGPTPARARGPRWRRSSAGLYVPSSVDGTLVEQRVLEQSRRLGSVVAVTGWASLRLAHAGFFDGLARDGSTMLPVPLAAGGHQIRPRRGHTVSRERLDDDEVVLRHGIRCTTLRRALFDEMRRTGLLRDAVVAMDMTAAAELVSISQMRDYLAERVGWNGVPLVRKALDLADEGGRSPAESRLRLVWVLDAGLAPPMCNRAVFDLSGRHLGTVDLFDPVAGMVGEYDGAEHRRKRRHARDVDRQDRFRRAGLDYFVVVALDMHDPKLVVERITLTQERALAWVRPAGWTLRQPDHWEPDLSLDDRFALRRLWAEQASQM